MQRFKYRIETIAFTPSQAGADQPVAMLNAWGKRGRRLRHLAFDSQPQANRVQIVPQRRLDRWL